MVRHTSKILQHLLQDFKSESDHFGTLYIQGSKVSPSKTVSVSSKCPSIFNQQVFIVAVH